ncbi:MAG: methyltransferase domain-containing protein [Deltaproteobacteria bacterium]|nr:methyltransferase domain-containing protein [Deltaproteobacteria bacterium]
MSALAQDRVTRIYDRQARLYDALIAPLEVTGCRARRRRLLARAHGATLEVGIGTGKNLEFYGPDVNVVGVDVAPHMLARARRRATRLALPVKLELADIRELPYEDGVFDTVVATCLFCSVPDPVRGLAELGRVVKPGGAVLLLEHVRPRGRFGAWLADTFVGFTRAVLGDEWNRCTEQHLAPGGLEVVDVRREGIWREIVARPGAVEGARTTVAQSRAC